MGLAVYYGKFNKIHGYCDSRMIYENVGCYGGLFLA
jgi:hypothetical protein